ncbi:Aldehyde oxidoreductase [Rhodobacterales bacterium HTCC2150]|nr:Aldehyde oxidoreductase [Rhodobacterales bacterium HTCC2150] [Rhodobacteraceae bacterium HTCC2150]
MLDDNHDQIDLTVNGKPVAVKMDKDATLLELLREDLDLTGAKKACDNGECGSCIVLMNGKPAKSCLLPASRSAGKDVVTIEGFADTQYAGIGDDILHPLQEAFLELGATQCGFCIPGMILRSAVLLKSKPEPSRDDVTKALSKNLCRCTGYTKIIEAVHYAGELMRRNAVTESHPAAPVGKSVGYNVPNRYSPDTVNGEAKYTADLKMEGMLHAKLYRSEVHHARILRYDLSKARALPGVVTIVGPDDIPGTPFLPNCQPQAYVFPKDKIRFKGEALFAVAATSERIAEQAVDLIEVVVEELPHAIELSDAARPNSARLYDFTDNVSPVTEVSSGDIREGFAKADLVIEKEYSVPVREHAAMEPEAALAYEEDDGQLVIKSPLYHAFVQGTESIANNLAMKKDDVRIVCPAMGGNFGTRGDTLAPVVAGLLAQKTGKPVKLVFSRAESILGSCKAPSVNVRYKTGAMRDGTIVAVEVDILHGTGSWAPYLIPDTTKGMELCYFESLPAMLSHVTGPYSIPNVKARAYDVLTNGPRFVPLRGTNANYLPIAYESQVDLVAGHLGMDPLEVRKINAIRHGDITHIGQEMTEHVNYVKEIDALRPHYDAALARLDDRRANAMEPWVPGLGVGGGWRNVGYVSQRISAGAELLPDGTFLILAGTVEQGQGPTTQFAQIGADALEVPVALVSVLLGDTSEANYPVPTFSSITTVATGKAVQMAADNLQDLMFETAAKISGVDRSKAKLLEDGIGFGDQVTTFSEIATYLDANGLSRRCTGDLDWNGEAPNILYGYNLGLIELDVNTETGQVKLRNHVNVCDPGTIVNPLAVEGQVDGGISFGVGFALTEAFHPDNPPTLVGYGIPTTMDVPDTVTRLYVEDPFERGPFGAKSVAEHPGISPIPAIINAISNATGGARVRDIPATPDRVLAAIEANRGVVRLPSKEELATWPR